MSKSPLLDQVREVLRLRHYSIRTEEAYVQTIRRFHTERRLVRIVVSLPSGGAGN